MSQSRRSQQKGRYLVADLESLSVLIQEAIQERYGGNRRKAARALPIGEDCGERLLRRLGGCKTKAVSGVTIECLDILVGESGRAALLQTLVTPEARIRLAVYRRWTVRALRHTPGSGNLEPLLRRQYPTLFSKFERFLEKHGHVEVIQTPRGKIPLSGVRVRHRSERAELAFREVLAPLRRDLLTAKIELGFDELKETEVKHYLTHAFAAQEVLLKRPLEIERAQSARERARQYPATSLAPPAFEGAPAGTYGEGVLDKVTFNTEAPARKAKELALSPAERDYLKALEESLAAGEPARREEVKARRGRR